MGRLIDGEREFICKGCALGPCVTYPHTDPELTSHGCRKDGGMVEERVLSERTEKALRSPVGLLMGESMIPDAPTVYYDSRIEESKQGQRGEGNGEDSERLLGKPDGAPHPSPPRDSDGNSAIKCATRPSVESVGGGASGNGGKV